jgi:hypothetical protein
MLTVVLVPQWRNGRPKVGAHTASCYALTTAAKQEGSKDTTEGAANADATKDHSATDAISFHAESPADHEESGIGEEAIAVRI